MKFNIKPFLLAIVSVLILAGMFTGTIQTVIPFADPLNEIFFCVLISMLFGGSLIASFSPNK